MDLDQLKAFGQIAAPAGIAIGAFLYVARGVIAKNIFPQLTKDRAYRVVISVAFMAWTVALAGIASWTYVATRGQSEAAARSVNDLTPLLGDTGWIFAGYFHEERETFIEGPYVSVQTTTKRGARRFIEIGDTVGLNVSRDVHIVDFDAAGTKKKLVSPITKGVIDEGDKTGVTLAAGTKMIVRDISEGSWPNNPNAALWLRVVHVPK